MFKRIAALMLIMIIILSVTPVLADSSDVVTVEPISKGLTLTNIKRKTTAGKLNINIIKADLDEPSLHLKVLTNNTGLDKPLTVKGFANKYGTAAAVNTDFFSWINGGTLTEGLTISENEILTSPSNDTSYATIAQKDDGSVFFDYFTYNMTLKSPRTEQSAKVHYYNKNGQDMYIKIFDSNFGEYAPDSNDDAIELVVEDGIVTEILSNKPAVKIPENGYVVKHSLRYSLFLTENFQVGDEVEITFDITPDVKKITEATGGGSVILKNGKKFPYTQQIPGRHPRTAVGTDESGKILYFVTIDGRQEDSVGMTVDELTALMQEIGAYNAINCDGGGSTQMVARLMGEGNKVVNSPSETRLIPTGIGIIADAGKGNFSHVRVTVPTEKIASGSPVDVWVRGYDEYGNEVNISDMPLSYLTNKQGKFEGNIYYPYETGIHTITVIAGGISGIRHIEVYEEAKPSDVFKKVKGNYNFGVFGSNTTSLTMFTNLVVANRNKSADKMNLSAFRTVPEKIKSETVTVGSTDYTESENALFVSFDNRKSGIMKNADQLSKLKATDKQNIFILLPQKMDKDELFEFKHMVRSTLYGKKVFVVYYGEENSAKAESGIYFISVCDIPAFDRNNFADVLEKSKYLKASFNGNDVGLSFESYFE